MQTHGFLELREDVILLTRDDGSTFGLPPDPELPDVADPDRCTLQGTNESAGDPDYLSC